MPLPAGSASHLSHKVKAFSHTKLPHGCMVVAIYHRRDLKYIWPDSAHKDCLLVGTDKTIDTIVFVHVFHTLTYSDV